MREKAKRLPPTSLVKQCIIGAVQWENSDEPTVVIEIEINAIVLRDNRSEREVLLVLFGRAVRKYNSAAPWTVTANMAGSAVSTTVKHAGTRSLRLAALGAGATQGDSVWQAFTVTVVRRRGRKG